MGLKIDVYEVDEDEGYRVGGPIRRLSPDATGFFYDGCHKIYLVSTPEDRRQMLGCGWEPDEIRPIRELPNVWEETCGLRFISSGDLSTQYVEQFEDATVTWES